MIDVFVMRAAHKRRMLKLSALFPEANPALNRAYVH